MVGLFTLIVGILAGLGLLVSAVFSVWGVWKISVELVESHAFRKKVIADIAAIKATTPTIEQIENIGVDPPVIDADGNEIPQEMEPDPFETEIIAVREQLKQVMIGINNVSEQMADFPEEVETMRKKIDGAVGRAGQLADKDEATFIQGLDDLADEQLLANLPLPLQIIAKSILEQVEDPRAIAYVRRWAATRPEMIAHLQAAGGAPGVGPQVAPTNPLDAYITR